MGASSLPSLTGRGNLPSPAPSPRYLATYTQGARQGPWQKTDPVPANMELFLARGE